MCIFVTNLSPYSSAFTQGADLLSKKELFLQALFEQNPYVNSLPCFCVSKNTILNEEALTLQSVALQFL